MTALVSLAAPPAAEALTLVPGQPVVAPAGFAAILVAAQAPVEAVLPAVPTETPVAPAEVAPAAATAPAAAAAPRYTPAQLWSLIDGETAPRRVATAARPPAEPMNATDSPPETPQITAEAPAETPILAMIAPQAAPMPVAKAPELPAQPAEIRPESSGFAATGPHRRSARPIPPRPVSPLARGAEAGSPAPITADRRQTPPARPEISPERPRATVATALAEPQMPPSSPVLRHESAVVTAMPPGAAGPAAAAVTASGPAVAPAASTAAPSPPPNPQPPTTASAALPARAVPPQPRTATDREQRDTIVAEAMSMPRTMAAPTAMPQLPSASALAPPPLAAADTAPAQSAAEPLPPSLHPDPATNVATEAFGAVRIGVDGDARDLKVSLSVTAGAPALLAADAPRLAADLAANGIRLQSLDVGSFAGGTASGGHPQRPPTQTPASAAPAAFAAPPPNARAAAADRYA